MALFGKSKDGGLMDVIRCDESDYLIWKWIPKNADSLSKKQNAIRWGSSLRVKAAEVAVFVYKNSESNDTQKFFVGPVDEIIKTDNFPFLTTLLSAGYAGDSPFQAEIYFINLAGAVQLNFRIPYFDVADYRYPDFNIPVAVGGSFSFSIKDYEDFINRHKLAQFSLDDLKKKIIDAVVKYTKSYVANVSHKNSIPVFGLDRYTKEISDQVESDLKDRFQTDFGINVNRVDISDLNLDKESEDYQELVKITKEQQTKFIDKQTEVSMRNLDDIQRINAEDMGEKLRISRKGSELGLESQYLAAHQVNTQADVMKELSQNLGSLGGGSLGGGGSDLNPAGLMTNIAVGGLIGGQISNLVNQTNSVQNRSVPPPPPSVSYNVLIDGKPTGPYDLQQIQHMILSGVISSKTYLWKQGMADWDLANNIDDIKPLLIQVPPPPPVV